MRFLRRTGLALLAFAAVSASALAQPYPSKPIHVVVPVTAGGLTDVIARRIAADASARLGQPWIMENKPGANFIPAAETCRHAKGDGYTLCVFTTSTVTFNPHLIEKLPYDAAKDFKPIINLGQFIGGLIASPKLGVKTVEDLRRGRLQGVERADRRPRFGRNPDDLDGARKLGRQSQRQQGPYRGDRWRQALAAAA
jgi:tripartite-type tricarboxylate transporter receptor subunit TctC